MKKFNPIFAAQQINETYRDYMKSTFFINDEEFREAYFHELDMLNFANGPYLECVDAFAHGKSLKQLVEEQVISPLFENLLKNDVKQYTRSLFVHQEQALRFASLDKNMIVTTGTGSGKTECFLYPVLDYLLKQEAAGALNAGVRILLLYPMNALANDQMQRLRQLLASYPQITFGVYTGETEESNDAALRQYRTLHKGEAPLSNERISRNQMKENPPHILVTNYAMLEYLLLRPTDTVFFDDPYFNNNWKFIVLDEAHVYSGASGMEVSILIRRLIHRLPHSERIRFILTSATLGDESKNEEILWFASSLCANAQFEAKSIIRATRRVMEFEADFTGDEQLYKAVSNLISSDAVQLDPDIKENIQAFVGIMSADPRTAKWVSASEKFQEILYEVFCHDTLYASIRKHVANGAISLSEIINLCGVSNTSIINFIQIANFAVKNYGKLLDARYHHFIRTLEGAYVSFYPEKTLSLVPRKSVRIKDRDYRCFKLSVCQFCGELYLEGTIIGKSFVQKEGEIKQYYMVIQPEFLDFEDDEDKEALQDAMKKRRRSFWLCTSCGTISKFSDAPSCSCDKAGHILIYHCHAGEEDNILHKCSHCKTSNPKGSVLRGFYLGQDASSAVVGEALFENIPETIVKREKGQPQKKNPFTKKVVEEDQPKKTRRLLLFSDSRQEAAYFAAYFQYTYDVMLNRRIIMKAARRLMTRYPEKYVQGIPILHLIDEIKSLISSLAGPGAIPSAVEKEAYKALIGELKDFSRNSLHSIGWIDYQLTEDVLLDGGYEEGSLEFPSEELNLINRYLLEYCMHHGALQLLDYLGMTAEDWSSISFSNREPVIQKQRTGAFTSGVDTQSFVPITQNAITEYLSRVFPADLAEYKNFLGQIFDDYLTYSDFKILVPKSSKNTYFKVNPEKIKIVVQGYHPIKHYQCDTCGRITTISIKDKCTSYRCNGTLAPYYFEESETKAYFIKQYGKDAPLIPLSIKEHTAQLSKATAQEYQQRFIDGDINMLSCSTTFEMGVDVGDLETVFMKNVPPKPSNYIQRAGRAGRRLTSAAFSLTFCKLGPHDFYYYQRPADMINGTITPPTFKIDNPKIVRRHVFAVLLAYYWRRYFADKKQIQDFLSESGLQIIVNSLRNVPNEVMEYLQQIVPDTLVDDIPSFIEEYRENLLPGVAKLYQSDVGEYQEAVETEKAKTQSDYGLLSWLSKVMQTYQQEQILSFYSRYNLIPKYGFPVDTVTLFTDTSVQDYEDRNSKLLLQRDLIQAISEYAPESEVIADGNMFTSQYIKKPMKKDTTWRQYRVLQCEDSACGRVIVEPYTGEPITGRVQCGSCGNQSIMPKVMIIPEFGFITRPGAEKVTTKRPSRTSRTEFYYLGDLNEERAHSAKQYSFGTVKLSVVSSPDDRLLVMNKSDFLVCQTCGYAELAHNKPFAQVSHTTPRGYACKDTRLTKRSFGHVFRTDVALITVNRVLDHDEAITILYTLLEGCSKYFDIERDDIAGCISYQSYVAEGGVSGTTFVLFDSVPGGAGNVKRLYDADRDSFIGFLQCALDRVKRCDCGNDGDTVCYSCLCNFKNQFYQDNMQRRYAIQFLEKLVK